MIIDTAVIQTAREELQAAREDLARAQARVDQAEQAYEDARRMLQAAAGTISMLLDDRLTARPTIPALPPSAGSPRMQWPRPLPVAPEAPVLSSVPAAAPAPSEIPRSVWDVITVLPRDGTEMRIDAVRDRLGITGPACATRFVRAKKIGLIETTTMSTYRLSEKGRALVEASERPTLQVVPNE